MKYSKLMNTTKTSQRKPLPYAGQRRNHAGGFGWSVDRWNLLDRFLILGSENGTFYVGAQELTADHAKNVIEVIKEDGERVVERIVDASQSGLAPKNDPAIFALALAASLGDDKTRSAALKALPLVCRTGTHLFAFAKVCNGLRGWGRGMRKAVANWYLAQPTDRLEYGLVKYQAREGWSHRDLLRLSHPQTNDAEQNALFKWVVDGEVTGDLQMIRAMLALREIKDVSQAADLIKKNRLPREAIPTEMLTESAIWEALLADMPLTAVIRNLGNMTKIGLLKHGWLSGNSDSVQKIIELLRDSGRLERARIHPIGVLAALNTYALGHGVRGNGSWKPVQAILDVLDEAFYASFKNAPAIGKRLVLGLDVSGSMVGTQVAGVAGLDCRKAAGAMALIHEATEGEVTHLAFDTSVYPLKISRKERLDKVVNLLARTGGGGTDCAAPIRYAIDKKIRADAFILYTDSETWYGSQHPTEAITEYRSKMGIDAKLIVVAMASTRNTIADPRDAGTLNIVGFDSSVPQVIADFLS
ncbi:MAG: TROVE domain-containing protein [Fimbriimonadaceae bacterium]|nr:MAG: TROVE domain-containing protein [Fimbriimonadaceae bacterium]